MGYVLGRGICTIWLENYRCEDPDLRHPGADWITFNNKIAIKQSQTRHRNGPILDLIKSLKSRYVQFVNQEGECHFLTVCLHAYQEKSRFYSITCQQMKYSRLSPCGNHAITDTPLMRTRASPPAKRIRPISFFLRLASSDRPKFLAFSKKKSNDVVKPFFTWNNSLNLSEKWSL